MEGMVIVLIIIAVFLVLVLNHLQRRGAQLTAYPYRKKDTLFTPAERSFLGVLNQAVGRNAQIFGKVRVADVITPRRGMSRSDRQKSFNKISSKHFDFLLCDNNDLSVICVIELNDSSHNSKKRQDRDKFLEGACKSANVPLIKIAAQSAYNINEIRKYLPACIFYDQAPGLIPEPAENTNDKPSFDGEKVCPKCSLKMIKRIATKGKNIGNEFWVCSAFPKCRHIEVIIS